MLEKIINKLQASVLNSQQRGKFLFLQPSFVFSLTTRCNFNCPHCLRSDIDKNKTLIRDIPVSVFEKVLKEAKKINFRRIALTGGESILHPQFEELISLIIKYDYRFSFVTNGWFYKEYWQILKNKRKNLNYISFSLDGTTAEVHDAVRNKPGSFEKVVEAIKFYQKNGVTLIAGFCATQKNYHQINEFPEFCLGLGIKIIKWMTVMPVRTNIGRDSCLTDVERASALKIIAGLEERYKGRCSFIVSPSFYNRRNIHFSVDFCPALNGHFFYIDQEGKMSFCCDIRSECRNLPSVADLGFEESFKTTLDSACEMKKKFLSTLLNEPQRNDRICDFCNENIGDVFGCG